MRKGEAVVCWLILLSILALIVGVVVAFGAARYQDGWRDGYADAVEGFVRTADNTSSAARSAAPSPQGEGFTLIPLTQEQADKLHETIPAGKDPSTAPLRGSAQDDRAGIDGAGGFDCQDKGDWERLAIVIYQEAGSDWISDETRRMVADVVLNRVADERFPDTIEGVLTQPWQYGRFCETGIVWPESAQYECNAHAVERARRIAEEVLCGQHSEIYGQGYIWQAEFSQGSEGFWQDGVYFGR